MPLRLTVGVSKKVGRPEYGSVGASCGLEVELPEGLLYSDLEAFHERVHDAYVACHQAVFDELSRLNGTATTVAPQTGASAAEGRDGDRAPDPAPAVRPRGGRPRKPATPSQVRAIAAIAKARHADLAGLLRAGFGVERPEELSVSEASRVIDALKTASGV
jgi:hypothetical protein